MENDNLRSHPAGRGANPVDRAAAELATSRSRSCRARRSRRGSRGCRRNPAGSQRTRPAGPERLLPSRARRTRRAPQARAAGGPARSEGR
jgi:hypothetical protein